MRKKKEEKEKNMIIKRKELENDCFSLKI